MAMTRTAMIDDDGTGTTGTILNNAWKQELYNQIDSYVDGTVVAWTPIDGSGAGLAFSGGTSGVYVKTGKRVAIWGRVIYPSTANALGAKIGGLPFANGPNTYGGCYPLLAMPTLFFIDINAVSITLLNPTTTAALTNANVSAAQFIFQGSYLTA